MKNKLALILGSASLAFTSTVLLAATSPAFAVDHGDNGGANYAGVEWDFAQQTSVTAVTCGRGPCTSLKPYFVVKATVRNDGKVCNEEKNFSPIIVTMVSFRKSKSNTCSDRIHHSIELLCRNKRISTKGLSIFTDRVTKSK